MGFGEVCVKEPSCGCFSRRGNPATKEETLRIAIAVDDAHLQSSGDVCRVWLGEKSLRYGRGQLKCTYRFQSRLRTMPLSIRILKILQTHDRVVPGNDAMICRIVVSQRDFRTLQEIIEDFVPNLQKMLNDAVQHPAFASSTDLIQQKLDAHALAIAPDAKGFVLFRNRAGSRPEHALLRIRPMAMELCSPQFRSLLPTFASERRPVTTLQEALKAFTQSLSWPGVRWRQFGIEWRRERTTSQSKQTTLRVESQWDPDTKPNPDVPFLDDSAQDLDKIHSKQQRQSVHLSGIHVNHQNDSHSEELKWNVDSVKSLVRKAAKISIHDDCSVYAAIEKATVVILSNCEIMSEVFVDSVANVVKSHGLESLGVYKLLASTIDLPSVKKAVVQTGVLIMLVDQYRMMTQIITQSTESDSNDSNASNRASHMEVNRLQYVTYTHSGETETIQDLDKSSFDSETSTTASHQGSLCQVKWTGSQVTNHSTRSLELDTRTMSSKSLVQPVISRRDFQQDVPRLTFYWLSQHEALRSTNSGATHTTLSLTDGRVFDEDLRIGAAIPPRGVHPLGHVTLTCGSDSTHSCWSSSETIIENTLHAWGVHLHHGASESDLPVAYAIKCKILEILIAFSSLNLETEIQEDCCDTEEFEIIYGTGREDRRHPPSLMLVELLAPHWQVFPGEQPSIRWGPTDRGLHLALALMHEYACRLSIESPCERRSRLRMRLFKPRGPETESYLSLIVGAKTILEQIIQGPRVDDGSLEEATSLVNVLADFVASSPSFTQAQLVAYSISNTLYPTESSVFKTRETTRWPISIFRLFHSILRLFRCLLERATDVVSEEFLITTLLKRDGFVKLVRDFSRAVLFSEKLERTCGPEEIACLRLGIWSYHTAVVKVIRTQHEDAVRVYDTLPRDYRDAKPIAFGQDPLDFLRYLVFPGEGHAAKALQKNHWGVAQTGPPLNGGLRAQVLLFLKILFSIPNNTFLKQRDITSYYLKLHWNGFRQNYIQDPTAMNSAPVICRLHLEVIRVIMGHHHKETFEQVLRLGIMDSLANEIALETAHNNNLMAFQPPPSQLTEQHATDIKPTLEQAFTSKTIPFKNRRFSGLSTDAESGLLSSIELVSSEGLATQMTYSMAPSSKGSQESCTSQLIKSISFNQKCPAKDDIQEKMIESPVCASSSKSLGVKSPLGHRFRIFRERNPKSAELPSRLPLFTNGSTSGKLKKEQWRSNLLFSFRKKPESKGLESSLSAVPPFQTRIPPAPTMDPFLFPESSEASRAQSIATEPGKERNGGRKKDDLFGRKKKSSAPPSLETQSSDSDGRILVQQMRRGGRGVPGISPAAEVKLIQSRRSGGHDQNADFTRVLKRNGSGGMRATISYCPPTMHVPPLSFANAPNTRPMPVKDLTVLNFNGNKGGFEGRLDASHSSLCIRSPRRQRTKRSQGGGHTSPSSLDQRQSTHHSWLRSGAASTYRKWSPDASLPIRRISIKHASFPPPNRRKESFDESYDLHGPPTFGIYCGARLDRRSPQLEEREGISFLENLPQRCSPTERTSLPRSSVESFTRFDTPSDFEYTGDVAEDCRRLEMLEKEFYGLSTESDITSSVDIGRVSPVVRAPVEVPLLKMGLKRLPRDNPPPSLALRSVEHLTKRPVTESQGLVMTSHSRVRASPVARSRKHQSPDAQVDESEFRDRDGNEHSLQRSQPRIRSLLQVSQGSSASWLCSRSIRGGFETPSDFEYTGDVADDVKKLEKLERLYYGESTPTYSDSDSEDLDLLLDDTQLSCEPRSVPKLKFVEAKTEVESRCNSRSRVSDRCSPDPSTFSWMQATTRESVGESEFDMLMNEFGDDPCSPTEINLYEASKHQRYVYSDVALRSVWVEVLLEGMLLEYDTRPNRDHDTYLPAIDRIIKYIPKVLMHHLDHETSKPVIDRLKKKLGIRESDRYRLLRLLSAPLFPAEIHSRRERIARGAFAHVFRCYLPFEGVPETCVLKVMDHPVDQDEMSTVMDVFSEISIMEQFKEESCVSHMYDYGIVDGNVCIVMKDYRCSLLEWRKRLPERYPGGLRLFLRVFRDVVDAVKVLHDRNVVHFDLKCSNVLLEPLPGVSEEHFWNPPTEEPPFRVVLSDFGEARSYSNDWEARTIRNRGTEFNKSPEMLLIARAQQTDGPEYDRRKRIGAGPPSDVWALGCLLFELMTGEFLQQDVDWSRFFLRVTTNTMSIVDSKKQKMLVGDGQAMVSDLLESILIRTHLWRPNLTCLSRKLDVVISSHDLPPHQTNLHQPPPSLQLPQLSRQPFLTLLGTAYLPVDEVVSLQRSLKIARLECLCNPWILSENDISLIVCIQGTQPMQHAPTNLQSTTSRANIELLEISLGEDENVSDDQAEIILDTNYAHCLCFTCEDGFESETYDLILRTLLLKSPRLTIFECLMDIRRQLTPL